MSARQKDLLKHIYYPESDGQPMGETDKHILLLMNLRFILDMFFCATPQVYVGSNLMCYYVEGHPKKSISPDVFVVRGAEKGERRVYKFWEEPAPQVVFELSSRKTRKADLTEKKDIYAWLGVREYFVFDPEYKLKPPLRAFRLRGQELVEEIVTGNRVISHELGLELVNDGLTLRLYNPQTNEFLRTAAEEYVASQEAEDRVAQAQAQAAQAQDRAAQAQARAAQAEDRAAYLAARLRALGIDPDHE